MLLLEPSTSTLHDSIPSNQNHTGSLGCQLHVSKRLPKTNITLRSAELRCLCCYDFAFSETSSESLFEFLSASLSIELPHEIKTLCLYLLAVGDVRAYCELSNHCHIQILDVSHDLVNGFVSGLPFSSPPSPLPHLKSPRP